MAQKTDPWEKAAECAREMRETDDPRQRSFYMRLQAFWIALGNEPSFLARTGGPVRGTEAS